MTDIPTTDRISMVEHSIRRQFPATDFRIHSSETGGFLIEVAGMTIEATDNAFRIEGQLKAEMPLSSVLAILKSILHNH